MFVYLSVVLFFALLSFGGVLRYAWFALCIAWLLGLILLALSRRRVDLKLALVFVPALAALILLPANTAAVFIALPWAWYAAQRSERAVVRFLHLLLVLGLLEAFLGFVQYFVIPGWILGYQNPFASASGTFINRNHYAGFLEMIIPVSFGLSFIQARKYGELAGAYLYLLASALMGLVLFLSASRMGIISLLATLVFLTILVRLRVSEKRVATAMGLTVIGLFLLGAVWMGVDVVWQRYASLLEKEGPMQDGRLLVYRDTLGMIVANPLGVGINSYRDVFRKYQTYKPDLLFDHAHNDYLETAAEWGFFPAVIFWSFIGGVLIKSIRAFLEFGSAVRQGILLACIGSMFSILVHSFVDFNLQIPANAILFCALAGVAFAVSANSPRKAEFDRPTP